MKAEKTKEAGNMAVSKSSMESYFKDLRKRPLLPRAEVMELFKVYEKGQKKRASKEAKKASRDAFELLVESNLRLVVSIAKGFNRDGLEMEDLIEEGNIGLMRAVRGFDWRRGCALSTYATWWIRQGIMRHVTNKSRTIRLPAHAIDINSRKAKFRSEYKKEFGENPTDTEVSEALGITNRMMKATELGAKTIISINSPAFAGIQNKSHGSFGMTSLQDRIPDIDHAGPHECLAHRELEDKVRDVLSTLTAKEESIIRLRFGIVDEPDDHERWPLTKKELNRIKRGKGLTDTNRR